MTVPRRLQVEVVVLFIVSAFGFGMLFSVLPPNTAALILPSVVPFVGLFGYVTLNLPANRSKNMLTTHSSIGWANAITLFRGILICSVVGFAVTTSTSVWIPMILFGVAAGLDLFDGFIARRTIETELGRRLDDVVDALTILLGGLAAIFLGGLSIWYILAGLLWYVYTGSRLYRQTKNKPIHQLPPSPRRGIIGGSQMLIIFIGLSPFAPHTVIEIIAAIGLLALTGSFILDWAAATGRYRIKQT